MVVPNAEPLPEGGQCRVSMLADYGQDHGLSTPPLLKVWHAGHCTSIKQWAFPPYRLLSSPSSMGLSPNNSRLDSTLQAHHHHERSSLPSGNWIFYLPTASDSHKVWNSRLQKRPGPLQQCVRRRDTLGFRIPASRNGYLQLSKYKRHAISYDFTSVPYCSHFSPSASEALLLRLWIRKPITTT